MLADGLATLQAVRSSDKATLHVFFHDVDEDLIHRSMTMSVEICVFRMGRSHSAKTGNNLALGSCSATRLLATKCESSVVCSLVKQQTSHRTGFSRTCYASRVTRLVFVVGFTRVNP